MYIKLPDEIKNKKSCVYFKNKDEYLYTPFFRLAIDVYNKKTLNHPERAKQYKKYLNGPIFAGYKYLMSLKDIRRFEK